ncbi:tRNA pseudouridine synthase Pus10 isoform X2 [Ricinus communis]|uniref:tRNA pseudouridine synthase Pus10 isoform X2 n=1 Tax=Ricinus communis TaxID=3988 RepID=UPI00201AF0BF|nr:tRNA pseudouridine synthase Pus10 isoform X2 [Ricinus communis]
MSSETEAPLDSTLDAAAPVFSPTANAKFSIGDEDMRLFNEAVRSLPSHAVKDLLRNGICMRCIFRLLGVQGHIFFTYPLSRSLMHNILGESWKDDEDMKGCSTYNESGVDKEICNVCLGILQFIHRDDKGVLVKKHNAVNLCVSIAELIKQEGHQIDSFSLEVSIAPIIQENERVIRLYMERKYRSELWFQESVSKCICTKEALKFAIANPLERLLDVKSGPSSCRIRLTYTQAKPSGIAPNSVPGGEGCKRRKTGITDAPESVNNELINARNGCFDSSMYKGIDSSESSFCGLENHESSECIFPKEKVKEPCNLLFLCYRTPIYFGGRYLKFSRNVSQTRWIIDDERMGEASIEEIIGGSIFPMCQGDSYKFHAAGREDIDVRMLGSGRPFLVEIQNPRQLPSETLVKEIETKINNMHDKLVGVRHLKMVSNHGWTLMHEGEAEKQKQYCALVWISRPLEDQDLQSIASLKDMQILQRTPVRVLHRRSPLERQKIIHWMKIERLTGSCQYFLLHLCTQAGTYIKEFVHGDLGRTHPSIGSILGCRAEILQLDVTEVKMDCFLAE